MSSSFLIEVNGVSTRPLPPRATRISLDGNGRAAELKTSKRNKSIRFRHGRVVEYVNGMYENGNEKPNEHTSGSTVRVHFPKNRARSGKTLFENEFYPRANSTGEKLAFFVVILSRRLR